MELSINSSHRVLKNPVFINNIKSIVENTNVKLQLIIIPIRDYDEAAKSRERLGATPGGLWHANDFATQKVYYHNIISEYLYYMTKYNINTLFLSFEKMVSDKKYLFEKLENILKEKNINFEKFSIVYDEVSKTC